MGADVGSKAFLTNGTFSVPLEVPTKYLSSLTSIIRPNEFFSSNGLRSNDGMGMITA